MILLYPAPPLDMGSLSAEKLRWQLSLRQSAILEFTGSDNVGYLILQELDPQEGGIYYCSLRLDGDGSATRDESGYRSPNIKGAIYSAMDDWLYLDGNTELSWYQDLVSAERRLSIAAMTLTSGSMVQKLRRKFPPKRGLFEAQLTEAVDRPTASA